MARPGVRLLLLNATFLNALLEAPPEPAMHFETVMVPALSIHVEWRRIKTTSGEIARKLLNTMSEPISLDDLWNLTAIGQQAFDPTRLSGITEGARHYLGHAIAVGTPLASAVRLKMHGEIKLKDWYPFTAEQVICWNRGMIWRASARMYGMSIRGSDRLLEDQQRSGWRGAMLWKLFGIVPVMNASGPDIARSGAGRVNIEAASWLPSVLCGDQVSWTAVPSADAAHLHAQVTGHGETSQIDFLLDAEARLKSMCMPRWGNPDGAFKYEQFGGLVDAEGTFGGYTIPTRMRVGWFFGTDRFEPVGEFFRVTVDDAIYR